jgi:Flp pilus assembly protein TadG
MPASAGSATGGPGGPRRGVSALSTVLQVGLILAVVGMLVAMAVFGGGSETVAAVQDALATIGRFWSRYAAPPG